MIKAIAIDDEPLALEVIENFSKKIDFLKLEKTFLKPSEAIKHLKKYPVDLLFVDIQMPTMNGINFCKAAAQNAMLIFTTAFAEYAIDSYELNAIDYLLKPIKENRFNQAVQKAKEYFDYIHLKENTPKKFIYIRADYSLKQIALSEIIFIEGLDNYLKIYLSNKSTIVARMSMKDLIQKLPSADFIRVHRSFIIAFNKIVSVRNKMICLPEKEIPIGVSYEKDFFSRFSS